MRRLLPLFASLLLTTTLSAADIPSPDAYLGYRLGTKFTWQHRVVGYFEALAAASPLVDVESYGTTPEGRPLIRAVITAAKNRGSLEEIRAKVASLQDPRRTSRSEAESIASTTPVVVMLAFGVHGDETSSTECSMKLAWWLLTTPEGAAILDNVVVVIDPVENPDGRDHYVDWFTRASGRTANPEPDAIEHRPPWQSGRTNHYHVDMNRDWAWGTQSETRDRIALYRTWNPQVVVDFHEMGTRRADYFFPPVADPVNANIPTASRRWLETFGHANAEAFSERGWIFFVGENFDLFYPGYGDSWPTFHGAIGMTYEVAGGRSAGTKVARDDGAALTLDDRIERHFVSATTTLRTAAAHRGELLLNNYDTLASALTAAQSLFVLDATAPAAPFVARVLARQGIEVERLVAETTAKAKRVDRQGEETRRFPAGSIVVSTAQPLGAFARTMLERTSPIDKSFLDAQKKLVDNDESDQFYDITAWSLPLAAGVPAWEIAGGKKPQTEVWRGKPGVAPSPSKLGWAVSGLDPHVYNVAGLLLQRGIRFAVSAAPLKVGATSLPRGSLFVHRGLNAGKEFSGEFGAIIAGTGASAVPIDSFWTEGLAVGSTKVVEVREPKIAIAAGDGVDRTSLGPVWFQLDVGDDVPYTLIDVASLGALDYAKYRVLVLPDGKYDFDEKTVTRLKAWLGEGGTIVAIKGASEALRSKDVELSKLEEWKGPDEKKDDDRETKIRVPGAAFSTEMNERSYLTFGVTESPAVLIEGSLALAPLKRKTANVVRIVAKEPLLSGVAWPESIARLQGAPYLTIESEGKGKIVTFADEPDFRLFWRSTYPLLMNALLYSPSFDD